MSKEVCWRGCDVIVSVLKTLDNTKPVYSEAELQKFEADLREKELELGRRAASLQHEQELLKERGKALEAQRKEYQQVSDSGSSTGVSPKKYSTFAVFHSVK